MTAVFDLPTEVQHLLSLPGPQSLLVRGPPGTGKSSLTLSLLRNFPGLRILITSRVTEAALRRDFPWVRWGEEIRVVDITRGTMTYQDTARIISKMGEMVQNAEKETELRGMWLPDSVQEAFGITDPRLPVIIAIDSWDALIDRYLGTSSPSSALHHRGEIERLLLDQMAQGAIFLVIVVERIEPNQIDYLVNGVVETTSLEHFGRPERWLRLVKLRGTRIASNLYPFTLEGGRFRCIAPIAPRLPERAIRSEPEPHPVPGYIWPGSSDFANAFGRLPVGRISLLERDISVPVEALNLLVDPIAAHVARQGGRVLHVLPPNLAPEEVLRMYQGFLTNEQIHEQVRFELVTPELSESESFAKLVLPWPSVSPHAAGPRTSEAFQFLRERPPTGSPNLAIIWLTGVRESPEEGVHGHDPATAAEVAMSYVAGGPSHTLFLGPEGDPV
ncbi:MAG: gas vesicle protein GvpD P-loop domain-containing protein, partial [Thermoplasmata archaeon]